MGMQYFEKAQSKEIPSLNMDGINAFLQDLVSSKSESSPITSGFFRIEKGNPLEYTYSYDECKIMLAGEMCVTEKGGDTVRLKPGDVIFFDKGTTATFSSDTYGTVFYVGQRKLGEL